MANILLIEDEEPIRRVMVKILVDENKSYQITEASHGKEGLEKLTRDNFDLILCDIKMPKMDGMEVLQQARKKYIYPIYYVDRSREPRNSCRGNEVRCL